MTRRFAHTSITISLLVLGFAGFAIAKQKNPKPGPLTATWECTAHGSSRGDMPFTLTLEQIGETVTGSVSSPIGSTELSTATYKKKDLAIHIDTGQGDSYDLTGKLKNGQLSGEWTHGTEKGAWEGKKQTAGSK
jgi:hypothetical protein